MARLSDSPRGTKRLRQVAELVIPGAASPFETKAGLLLTMPRTLGGFGHSGMVHNQQIVLTSRSRSLARKECCYCDLYWNEGIDVECQSAMAHDNEASYLSDSERTAALLSEGVIVLPLTYAQMADRKRLAKFSETLARLRGIPTKPKTVKQLQAEADLFDAFL